MFLKKSMLCKLRPPFIGKGAALDRRLIKKRHIDLVRHAFSHISAHATGKRRPVPFILGAIN